MRVVMTGWRSQGKAEDFDASPFFSKGGRGPVEALMWL